MTAASALLLAAATPAPKAAPKLAPRVITQPDWLEKPRGEDLAQAYPAFAVQFSIEGRAVVACGISDSGALQNCKAESEAPKGMGFGAAGVELAHSFRMRPMTVNGEPTAGGVVRIPIAFKLPTPQPEPPPELDPPTSPEAMEFARQLVEAGQYTANLEKTYADRASEFEFLESDTTSEPVRSAAAAGLRAALGVELPALKADLARIYAANHRANVLRDQIAFFQSSAGVTERTNRADFQAIDALLSRENQRLAKGAAREAFCRQGGCGDVTGDMAAFARDVSGPKPAVQISAPQWSQMADAEQVAGDRPYLAKWMGMGGYARLTCTVTDQGWLKACVVANESPKMLGFGRAAQKLAQFYRIAPGLMANGAAGETVAVQVVFPEDGAGEALSPPSPRSPAALALARAAIAAADRWGVADQSWKLLSARMLAHVPPDATPQETAAVLAAWEEAQKTVRPMMANIDARYMTHLYSDAELRELAAYWRSPAGQAWRAKLAQVEFQSGLALQRHNRKIMEDAGRRICAAVGDCPFAPAQAVSSSSPPLSTRTP